MKKFLNKIFFFLLIPFLFLIIVLTSFSFYLRKKWENYKLETGISTLYIGDSHIKLSVNSEGLKNAENLSHDSESYYFSYFKLKSILNSNPQIQKVYLGYGNHSISKFYDDFIFGKYSLQTSPKYFYLLPREEKIKFISSNFNKAPTYCLKLIKEGVKNIFFNSKPSYLGGYQNNYSNTAINYNEISKRINFQFHHGKSIHGFSELNILYLNKIKELCIKKNVELVLLRTPVHPIYQAQIPHQFKKRSKSIIEETGFEILDLSLTLKEDSFFIPDGDHVSQLGAEKVNEMLAP